MGGVRLLAVAFLMAGIALAVVCLRTEQTRCAADLLRHEARWIELRRQSWALQARAARLSAPARVHQRLDRLLAQHFDEAGHSDTTRTARLISEIAGG